MDVARETNFDILRQKATLLQRENSLLHNRLQVLAHELDKLRGADADSLQVELDLLQQRIEKQNHTLFGRSSERSESSTDKNETDAENPRKRQPQRGHGPTPQVNLPIVDRLHALPDDAEKQCTACGGELQAINGQFEDSDQIDVVQRSFVIVRHRRQKYRCQCGGCIVTTPAPTKLIAQGRYSIAFAAHVAVAKYQDHQPLTRQVDQMRRNGLQVTSQTLWDQIERLATTLHPSYLQLRNEILQVKVVGADETTWPLLDKPNKKWWAWSVTVPRAAWYRIAKSRSHEEAAKLLEGFEGTVVCDAYGAYPALRKARLKACGVSFELSLCWAHARRKFVQALPYHPEAQEAIDLIGKLYAIESKSTEGGLVAGTDAWRSELAALRQQQSVAVLDELQRWRANTRALPRSALGKALTYLDNQWLGLKRFLTSPDIPLDNNGTERSIRGLALGRNNHYGSKSREGTKVAALLYSLVETCKRIGIDAETYLIAAATLSLERPGTVLTPAMFAAAAEAQPPEA